MKSKFRLLFPLVIASMSLTSCSQWLADMGIITVVDGDDTIVDDVVIDNYYKGYNLKYTGGRLINELQKNCWDKHVNWVKYGQIFGYYKLLTGTRGHDSVEAIKEGSAVNEWFYTGKQAEGTDGGQREHVWPCANSSGLWTHDEPASGEFNPHYVDDSNYVGGGADLYHVRLCYGSVNGARGNSRFCDFEDPEINITEYKEVTENGGKYSIKVNTSGSYGNKSEPADQMKGDCARIVLYVWLHYTERGITPTGQVSSGTHVYKYDDFTASLPLTAIMGYDTEEKCKEVLKDWNKIDPPSEVEKLRNVTVQKIQGNRNPFVDYPELVDKMFA